MNASKGTLRQMIQTSGAVGASSGNRSFATPALNAGASGSSNAQRVGGEVSRDAQLEDDGSVSPWWFIGGAAVLGVLGGVAYAVWGRKHNPIFGASPSFEPGYTFVVRAPEFNEVTDPLKYARSIPSEEWDIEMLTTEDIPKLEYVCRRDIDGAMCNVWYNDEHGALVAQRG